MKKLLLASSLLLALTVNAQAGTVDFSDTAINAQQPSPFTSGELTFTPTQGYIYTYTDNPGSYNGTNALIAGWGQGVGAFSFKETNDSVFSLNSLDAGTTWYSSGSGSVTFTGHQVGGGTLLETLALNNAYANYAFGWANLLSVDVSANAQFGYVAYDNINVSTGVVNTPIPAAVWLFSSALTGLMGFGRRKQALQALAA